MSDTKKLLQRCYAFVLSIQTADQTGDIEITEEQREVAEELLRELPDAIKADSTSE